MQLDKTSLATDSDYSGYFDEWCKTNNNDSGLTNFRNNLEYSAVVPSDVNNVKGNYYYKLLKEEYPEYLKEDKFFEKMDFGNPRMYEFEDVGLVDPVVLRMIYVFAEMDSHFKLFDGMSICEIGPGNGILFKIISDIYDVRYTFIDIWSAMYFTKKNVEYYGKGDMIDKFVSCKDVLNYGYEPRCYDLVISEHAYDECYKSVQLSYINKIMNHSKCGRILCCDEMFINKSDENHLNTVQTYDMIKHDNKLTKTYADGVAIIWGDKNENV